MKVSLHFRGLKCTHVNMADFIRSRVDHDVLFKQRDCILQKHVLSLCTLSRVLTVRSQLFAPLISSYNSLTFHSWNESAIIMLFEQSFWFSTYCSLAPALPGKYIQLQCTLLMNPVHVQGSVTISFLLPCQVCPSQWFGHLGFNPESKASYCIINYCSLIWITMYQRTVHYTTAPSIIQFPCTLYPCTISPRTDACVWISEVCLYTQRARCFIRMTSCIPSSSPPPPPGAIKFVNKRLIMYVWSVGAWICGCMGAGTMKHTHTRAHTHTHLIKLSISIKSHLISSTDQEINFNLHNIL